MNNNKILLTGKAIDIHVPEFGIIGYIYADSYVNDGCQIHLFDGDKKVASFDSSYIEKIISGDFGTLSKESILLVEK